MNVLHAKQRAQERYNVRLNRRRYYELVGKIMCGQSRCIRRVSNTRTIHEVDGMIAVYSSKFHKIVTFLPTDCWEAND